MFDEFLAIRIVVPPILGDLDANEACDDGNLEDEDGCSASCTIESGYACSDDGCSEVVGIEVGEPYHPVGASFGLTEIVVADCPQGFLVGSQQAQVVSKRDALGTQ